MGRRNNLKLTPEVEQQFLWFVQMGQYPAQAARAVGVTPQAISMRRKRDRDFAARVDQAVAKFQMGCLARINRAAERGEWKAAFALLERRFPEEWGRAELRLQPVAPSDGAKADVLMWEVARSTLPMIQTPVPAAVPVAAAIAEPDSEGPDGQDAGGDDDSGEAVPQ